MKEEKRMGERIEEDLWTYKVFWSPSHGMYIGVCEQMPNAQWESRTPEGALVGIRGLIKQKLEEEEDTKNP